jgi:tetratricopeptide (TPR) repeat protein
MHSARFGALSLIVIMLGMLGLFAPLDPVQAQTPDPDKQACGASQRGEAQIAACTRIIERRGATPRDRAVALNFRGNGYRFLGDLDRAIADYDQSIRLDARYAGPRNGRAYAKMQKAKFKYATDAERALIDSALIDLDAAVQIDPRYLTARANRVDVYRVRGETDRAFAENAEMLRIDAKYGAGYATRAALWRVKGEIDRAIADFGEAIRLNHNVVLNLVHRGVLYEKKGDEARAKADFEAALRAPPTHDFAKYSQDLARKRLAVIAANAQAAANPPAPGRRIALVVGNSGYSAVPALPNPRRDAEAIAAGLRRAGFQSVTVENDLTREKLFNALSNFARAAEGADWAVVYFAGHGIEVGGVNYLIPTDAKLSTDRSVNFEAIALEQVLTAVEGAKRLRLVLLDACRDNPFARQMRRTVATRSIGRGLAAVEPEAGTLVVYAAKHGETALDGEGTNSPFVKAFLKNLATPGVEIRKFFDLVRDDVMEATNRKQQPFTYGSVPGRQDFFFVQR